MTGGLKILVTGSAGFIGGYVVDEVLRRGYEVVGLNNYSKYGPVKKSYDDHPHYHFVEGDARDTELLTKLLDGCHHIHRRRGAHRWHLLLPRIRV